MITYFITFFFAAFTNISIAWSMEQVQQQHIKPKAGKEKIDKWRTKAMPFMNVNDPRYSSTPPKLTQTLCPEPVPEFHEELTLERLFASDAAKKIRQVLQQKPQETLDMILREIYYEPVGWSAYKWKRYAGAIAIAAGASPNASSILLNNTVLCSDFTMAQFLLDRGANPNTLNNEKKNRSFLRNEQVSR